MTSARGVAIDALVRVEQGAFSNLVLPSMLRPTQLSSRDRAFVTDLVYDTLRRQRRLDDLVGRVVDRPVGRLDPAEVFLGIDLHYATVRGV